MEEKNEGGDGKQFSRLDLEDMARGEVEVLAKW